MGDPLSIIASVLGIAAAAFQGCKKVNDFISAFVNVPKVLKDLQKDLDTIQILLQSLETALAGTDDESLSESQKACFRDLQPALCDCRDKCDEFAAKLFDLTKHSKEGKVNWRDRIRVQFGDEEIELCKSMLQRYISTLDIAIGLATFKSVRQNRDSLQELETTIAASISSFTGQLTGLDTALHALSVCSNRVSRQDVEAVKEILDEHGRMLRQCLRVSTNALDVTTAVTGTNVQYAKAYEESRQFIGNIGDVGSGGPATNVVNAEARGKSKQMVGNMSSDLAKGFWA